VKLKQGWVIDKGKSFPKLQALRSKLQPEHHDESDDEQSEEEKLESSSDEGSVENQPRKNVLKTPKNMEYIKILAEAIRINQKKDTDRTRQELLNRFRAGYIYLLDLCFPSEQSPSSQLSISLYPSRNVRKLSNLLYRQLRKHWGSPCGCPNYSPRSLHAKKELQLNLVTYRRFDLIAPEIPHENDTGLSDAKFEILLPTTSESLLWQEVEIWVKDEQ
jgi:hypothetical protein